MTTVAVAVALNEIDRSRLVELEEVVEHGIASFVAVGSALVEIRDSRLYRAEFATFEVYLDERWGMSRAHGYRLINSARVMGVIDGGDILTADSSVSRRHLQIGDIPANEAQAR